MGLLKHFPRSRALHPLVVALGLGAASLALPSVARAQQPTPAERDTARSRMEEGEARRDRGDLRGALRFFEEADAIMRVPSTGLEVARTQVQLGLLLEAKETLARVVKIAARPGEPPAFGAARRQADQLLGDLGPRIPTLAIAVKNADAATTPRIQVDGENVPASSAETPKKMNPGTHLVLVSAGNLERREEVKLVEGEKKVVTIDLAGAAPVAASSGASTTSKASASETTKEDGRDKRPETSGGSSTMSKVLVYGGFGVGIVGVGVGAVTGLMSFSKVDDVKTKCGGETCPPAYQSDVDSAKSLGNIATIAFIAGGVGVAAGVVGLVVPFGSDDKAAKKDSDARAASGRVAVQPVLSPSYVGLTGTF